MLVGRGELTEIVGREKRFGETPGQGRTSRDYTAERDALDHVYELNGDTLTIRGTFRGSAGRYTGTFSADSDTITGASSWPGDYSTNSTRQPNSQE